MADPTTPLLLRVLSGPGRSGFALVRAGGEVVIGRDDRSAGLCLEDPLASRTHAAVRRTSDGRCYLRDLGSRNGTRLDGVAVRGEVELSPGARIEIGGSALGLVELGGPARAPAASATDATQDAAHAVVAPIEPATPPQTEERPPEARPQEPAAPLRVFGWIEPLDALARRTSNAPQGSLQHRLRQSAAAPLYALVDAAADAEAPAGLALRGYRLYTLFEGEWAETLAFVGPCLVPAEPPEGLLDFFVEALGGHLGILLESPAPLEELVRHLRSVFVATDEEGQEYFFRFYDPRVLRAFLPTCTPDELRELFGPISRVYYEDPALPGGLRAASLVGDALVVDELRAGVPAEAAA